MEIQQIKKLFSEYNRNEIDDQTAIKIADIGSKFKLQVNELLSSWEAFSIQEGGVKLEYKFVEKWTNVLKKDEEKKQKEVTKKVEKKPTAFTTTIFSRKVHFAPKKSDEVIPAVTSTDQIDLMDITTNNDKENIKVNAPFIPVAEKTYNKPTDTGKPYLIYNEKIHVCHDTEPLSDYQISLEQVVDPYNFMWETPEKVIKGIQIRVNKVGQALVEKYQLEPPMDPSYVSKNIIQEPFTLIGMVISGEGANAVMIHCYSENLVVRLKLDLIEIPQYTLFPGQVIAVIGTHPYGTGRIVAKALCIDASLPPSKPIVSNGLKVAVAAGPYTSNDDVTYDPLEGILKKAEMLKSDILILMGPFIDVNNKKIQQGYLPKEPESNDDSYSFSEFFEKKILPRLKLPFKVIVVPSSQDVTSIHTFPQPSFTTKFRFENIIFASNPSIIKMKDVKFGICSNDILSNLSRSILTKDNNNTSNIATLIHLILQQQSFYPLYPNPTRLGERHADPTPVINQSHYLYYSSPFDILLLPSSKNVFAQDVNGTLCINPGRVVDDQKRVGSFALVTIQPRSGILEESVSKNTRVEMYNVVL